MTDINFRDIYNVVSSVKLGITNHTLGRFLDKNNSDLDAVKHVIFKLEEIRLYIPLIDRVVRPGEPITGAWGKVIDSKDSYNSSINKIKSILLELVDDDLFIDLSQGSRFRSTSPRGVNGSDTKSVFIKNVYNNKNISNLDAVKLLIEYLDGSPEFELELELDLDNNASQVDYKILRQIVPQQKLGPAMFDVVSGKLVVVRQPARAERADVENVSRARDALIKAGVGIIEMLSSSNCDQRIVESLRKLQDELESRDNIVELGLMNIAFEHVYKGASAELHDAVLGAIEGQSVGVGMYVAQFPEWQRFSENAARVNLDAVDILNIGEAAQVAINKLNDRPDIADPEVPKTLSALRDLIRSPQSASKKAAFAVLRTMENLISKIYQYGIDFLDKTVTRTIDGLSSAASKIIIASMLSVALASTVNLDVVASKVAEASWIKSAAEIVKKQIQEMNK